MRFFVKKHALTALILLLFVFLFLVPYFQEKLVIGADYMYHLARIETIADNLKTGEFPVKIHNGMNLGYGYGTGFFYPNFFFYLPALAVLFGMSLWNAYKCFAALIGLGIAFSMYFCVYYISRHRIPALIAAVNFLFCQPLLMDIYYRFAPGEGLAFIFLPIVFTGCYQLFYEDFDKPWILGLGFWGLGLSHPVSILGMLLAMIVMCLLHIRTFVQRPEKLKKLAGTTLVVLALSASYWIPMLEQICDQVFHFREPWTYVGENVVSFRDNWMGTVHSMGMGMIVVTLLGMGCVAYALFAARSKNKSCRQGVVWVLVGCGLVCISSWKEFWVILQPILNFLQFPWRIHMFACVLLCMGEACLLAHLFRSQWILLFLGVFSSCVSVFCAFLFLQPQMRNYGGLELLDVCRHVTSNGGGEEWQPAGFTAGALKDEDSIAIFNEMGQVCYGTKVGSKLHFSSDDFIAEETSAYYQLPYVYYKGYKAGYFDAQGHLLEHPALWNHAETHMLMMSAAKEIANGYYEIEYRGTWVQKLAYAFCYLAWVALVGYLTVDIWWRKCKLRNKEEEQ